MLGAARSAAEIGTDHLAKGDFSDVVIEVRNEHDDQVGAVTASMRIDRRKPAPHAPHSHFARERARPGSG
ncbi:hypothetical protein [Microvirga lotononidis]|uniref:hypothetical protein n=1 Tax=Microvirga lotononidis TaxID=864069 RepID=UPI0038994CB0